MRILVFALILSICSCNTETSTNVEKTNETDSDTIDLDDEPTRQEDSVTVPKTKNISFLKTIAGTYQQVYFEVKGSDTTFYICEDASSTWTLKISNDNPEIMVGEHRGFQDAFDGFIIEGYPTEFGFNIIETCLNRSDCEVRTEEWLFYKNGLLKKGGFFYTLEKNIPKFENRHCGIYDEYE